MNWYAFCAMGPDHPGIPEADLVEASNQPTIADLDHFVNGPAVRGGGAGGGGAWRYFNHLITQELDAGR